MPLLAGVGFTALIAWTGGVAQAADEARQTVLELEAAPGSRDPAAAERDLHGVVTWRVDDPLMPGYMTVHDETGTIWVNVNLARQWGIWSGDETAWRQSEPGTAVVITGLVDASGYAPMIVPIRIKADPAAAAGRPSPVEPTNRDLQE